MIKKEIKMRLYKEMLRIRLCEEKIAELYPQQEMRCPVHLSVGQEAPAVGVSAHLSDKDYAMSGHRAHAHYLAKGGDMKAMIAELYGKETGCCHGVGGSMHLIDLSVGFLGAVPIVGSIIPIGVGVALGSVMKKEPGLTVVYFGDGAVEEGVFHESMNFAALKNLPVVFLCENNFYSVYSNLSVRQPRGMEIYNVADAYNMESAQGDGNNVLEVYEMAGKAIEKARRGGGPTLLEFKTYRWREHCGYNYDNDIGYRTEEEFEKWKTRCPVLWMKEKLLNENIINKDWMQEIEHEINREIEEAVKFAQETPYPNRERLWMNLYDDKIKERVIFNEQRVEVFPGH